MIEIEINDAAITAALTAAAGRLDDLSPLMETIGDILVASTKKRFGEGVSPSGVKWAPNSPVTLARKRDPRPLFGPSGMLNSQITPHAGADFVEIGSNRVYSAMMQFGGTKEAYPHLWGDIPARPFLGLSEADEQNILDEISEALGSAFGP
jgi:phage virion morphogenesis protein